MRCRGTIPAPTIEALEADVATGRFHLVVACHTLDPRIEWIAAHCERIGHPTLSIASYFCIPADAR